MSEVSRLRVSPQINPLTASASPHPETIEVIVNGQPVTVKSGTVRDVVSQAVRLSGQIGAPIAQWQLRTTEGDVIPHDLIDGTDYELTPGRRLWLNLGLPVHLQASASPQAEIECTCDGGDQGDGLSAIPHEPHCRKVAK